MSIQKKRERTTLFLVLGIFALAVVNLSLFSFRIDLTSTGSYSISQASKDVVSQAKENIYLTYYVSKKLRNYEPAVEGLADFLDKYAAETGGKVKVKISDPQETGELNDMQRLGLDGRQMQVVEESQASQIAVFNGIVLQYQDRQEVLPWIDQLETLEYSLSDRVNRLVSKKTKNVGLIIGDPTRNLDNSFRILAKTLQSDANFRVINPGEDIAPEVNVLIVAGSRAIDEATAYKIDQYVMAGGKAFLALDGLLVDLNNPQAPVRQNGNSPLNRLVENWGVTIDPGMVLDEYYNVVQMGNRLIKYVEWPKVVPQNTSKQNPVTSRFGGLTLMWTSPLSFKTRDGVKGEALAWSSEKSWLMKDQMSTDPDQALFSASQAQKKSFPYIYALTGTFPSAYTAETVPAGLKTTQPPLAKSPASRVVVVGSSTFLTDMMGAETNAVFASNAVDWLAQDDSLLSIKTRPLRDRNLTLLQDAPVRQSAAFFLSFVNLFLVPAVVLVWGIVRFVRRSRRENKKEA